MKMSLRMLAGSTLAVAWSIAVAQAQPVQLTAADYARAESRLAHKAAALVDGLVQQPAWQTDDILLWLQADQGRSRVLAMDAATGQSIAMPDATALLDALRQAGANTEGDNRLGKLESLQRDADGVLQFKLGDDGYRCAVAPALRCERKPARAAKAGDGPAVASPDGRREAFIRDWNLWLRDTASGREWPITRDGQPEYGYATDNAGWSRSDRAILLWSPDSNRIATFRHDQRKVNTMTLVGTNVGAPRVTQWKYPFVGDAHIFMIERVILDVTAPEAVKIVRLDLPPEPHRSTFCDHVSCEGGWEDVQWAPDSRTLAFVSTDRGHKTAQLRVADAATGQVRDVYRETVKTQYESGQGAANWRYLPDSGEFVWFSEQSDWGHLYLHDLATGKRKRQLTAGHWNVSQIAHLDTATRTLWFRGNGREAGMDPYFTQLYRVSLDGGPVQRLTPEADDHKTTVSPGGRYFLDVHSTVATAPVAVVRRMADGAQVAELARADLTRLEASGWQPPESFTVKARDGKTDLYGLLFKPADFDPRRQYPIVDYVYPGPQVGSIRSRSFLAAHGDHQALAELGFIVVAIDGMGTPGRSKSFHDAYYGNMIDNTIPDQVAGIRQLAKRHAWIDGERVGIWGHSGGGNATATAMFLYPETFKVGVAQAGNHDNRSYEDDWGERYHGLLVNNEDGSSNYTGQDNAAHAHKLQGKLLLVHGMMDDNVPVQNTLLVVDALVKANKDFDLLLLPQARHGFGTGAVGMYAMRRRWDYFVTHLLKAAPPADYVVAPAAP